MILYRKGAPLRVRRVPAPEGPFWCATTLAPYSAKRDAPVAIDWLSLRASGAERVEVSVAEDVGDELDRMRVLAAPVLIDAAGPAEHVYGRGETARRWCDERKLPCALLVSTSAHEARVVQRGCWGVVVPLIYPVTTNTAWLEERADRAREQGASFFAAIPIDVEPTAKQMLAQSLELGADDDRYAMLFHASLEPIHLATERHAAALAHERGMADFVLPPRWEERTNWNAAVLLTRLASRMIALERDLDLAGRIARSARTVAELDKPVERVAEAASLSIIGGLDEVSVDVLTEWVKSGEAEFVKDVDAEFRLRR